MTHAREKRVGRAVLDIRKLIDKIIEEADLSDAEALRVVAQVFSEYLGGFARQMIRQERHPLDPSRPGGLE
jgi:hypothetical protein